ncbi:hypothetical protein BJ944DRAFT_266545 [Cunninghamella echinulata]|nr:hypothetical protein BJ944DRAFT_266545 [Cunninghamella echinulata]
MSNGGKRNFNGNIGSIWQENNGRISPYEPVQRKNENNTQKYNQQQRPIIPGKSVKALQNQWLAAQQQQTPNGSIRSISSSSSNSHHNHHRSISPLPVRSRLAFEPGNDSEEEEDGSEEEDEEQEEEQGQEEYNEDQEQDYNQERGIIGGNNNNNNNSNEYYDDISDKNSFMSSTSSSMMSIPTPPTHFGSSQEFKVAREGWLYKKNSLMQWRQVYAVAKHGNAVKPGALYLYKDDKFAHHIHTYDMSEVVEVEPKAQDYRAGIKWEFRLLVKRDDIVLATEDVTSRKDWINSLTSIMGKVSIATHTELQSRTLSMEQLNRQLQASNGTLQASHASLEQEVARLRQELSETQKREKTLASEHTARESGLTTELEHVRQTLEETERHVSEWQTKVNELEQQKMTWQAKAQDWQAQAHEWRDRVEILEEEKDHLLDEREQLLMMANNNNNMNGKINNGGGRRMNKNGGPMRMNGGMPYDMDDMNDMGNNSSQKDTIRDVKYQLQALRDQIKDPLLQSHVVDIKSGVAKLIDSFEESQRGWTELQMDIVKLLESEGDDRGQLIEQLKSEFTCIHDKATDNVEKLTTTLNEIQASQTNLLEFIHKNDTTTDTLIKQWEEQQEIQKNQLLEQQEKWLNELQTKFLDGLNKNSSSHCDGNGDDNNSQHGLTMKPTDFQQLQQQKYLLATLESHLETLQVGQNQGREDSDKSFKILGKLFQRVIQQLDEMTIPDISQPLDELVDRLGHIEERIHRIQLYRSHGNNNNSSDGGSQDMNHLGNGSLDDEDIRELLISTSGFMERTLRVLDTFGGNQSGLEETVRRAVKNAFNSHLDMNWNDPHNNEEKLKRYEENARGYIDKAMSGIRVNLEDYTSIMYKMIEDLIIRAVQRLENNISETNNNNNHSSSAPSSLKNEKEQQQLVKEIEKLKKERDALEIQVKQLGKENNDIVIELHKKKTELSSAQAEYDRVQRQIQQARQDSISAVARDLEPLVRQINMMKQTLQINDEVYSDDSEHSSGYVDIKALNRNSTSSRNSYHSIHNDQQQQQQQQRRSYTLSSSPSSSTKSNNMKDRTTTTPLSNYLNRKQ